MSSFLTSLWGSIFTPGPTPTLLLATNVTFGALQLTLLGLFLATYSAHFVALSCLCAGLWWAVNWFAAELRRAAYIEAEADRIRRRRAEEKEGERAGEAGDEMEQDDTETETETEHKETSVEPQQQRRTVHTRGGPNKIIGVMQSAQRAQAAREQYAREHATAAATATASGAETAAKQEQELEQPSQLLQRKSESSADLSSSSMTDSEWEKVSEGER